MGDPNLLKEGPDVAFLLPESVCDREQTAATEGHFGGLEAMADLAINHRCPQRHLRGIVVGFDAHELQVSYCATFCSAHGCRCAPISSMVFLSLLGAQLHHPMQRLR